MVIVRTLNPPFCLLHHIWEYNIILACLQLLIKINQSRIQSNNLDTLLWKSVYSNWKHVHNYLFWIENMFTTVYSDRCLCNCLIEQQTFARTKDLFTQTEYCLLKQLFPQWFIRTGTCTFIQKYKFIETKPLFTKIDNFHRSWLLGLLLNEQFTWT